MELEFWVRLKCQAVFLLASTGLSLNEASVLATRALAALMQNCNS